MTTGRAAARRWTSTLRTSATATTSSIAPGCRSFGAEKFSLARCLVPVYPLPMHYPSAPPLRLSSVNVLTDLGWWAGTFHVPGRQSLVDFMAPGSHVLKLTRVRVPNESERLPFVAVRRDAIIVVEPTQADELVDTPGS